MNSNTLLLIDSYAQIYRGYYAVRALTNSAGKPSNAIFSTAKFLLKIQHDYPDFDGAFVFDKGRPPHRMKIAPDYKANRPPMPEDLKSQMDTIKTLIRAFGWPMIELDDWEADDLLACIASRFSNRKIYIVSADKDLSQLIDGRVEMLVPDHLDSSKGLMLRGIGEVVEKFGVPPSGIVDYLAMIGDASDNIPGLNGVGPKTAAALLNQFQSIENMLAHTSDISKEKLREKVLANADLLRKNIELVRLIATPPESVQWTDETFCRTPPDYAKVREVAREFELKSILRELDQKTDAKERKTSESPRKDFDQPTLF